MPQPAAAENRGIPAPNTSRYRQVRRAIELDRWLVSSEYLRALYGERAAGEFERLKAKERALEAAGKSDEYHAILNDGFSEPVADRILWLSDEQQDAIAEWVDRLGSVLRLTYPSQAGRWLETPLEELGRLRPLDVITNQDEKGRFTVYDPEITQVLERMISGLQPPN